ncbi:pyridoxal phosphate-dependent decarboxylase family protein [Actinocorallia sp. A-T 12471]|uniref:pyridoxal phosphate-dependent decarboxylase family protein n=1 Tax=Actinocorallia sp. A-T 12471 TaxID=3089813 RepID=UPI0029CC652E|nr:pyridoxal-dependent decarboxylase [Actinocorallia sp. A-T 12471]MDX6741289.1 pyridoxal-dependent decarboxylase [Actinocorallia sp. A-T 12471]
MTLVRTQNTADNSGNGTVNGGERGTAAADLAEAFDPARFQRAVEQCAVRLRSHLDDPEIKGLDLIDPSVLTKTARDLMTAERVAIAPFDEHRLARIVDLYLSTGIQVHSPGYMGRQFSGTVPLAGLVDLVGSVANQPSSFYEAGQLPNVAERLMAEELAPLIGWDPATSAMVTTSGGSMANLTALLAARNRAFPGIWARGDAGAGVRPAVAISAEAHYSVDRAAGVLGIGEERIVRLPVDAQGRVRPELVGPALDEAERRGLRVFCLVASAGTTAMGAFDPLAEIAAITRRRGIWLHVDGAHGASLLVSPTHRGRLDGVAEADSLTWDAHKMLFVPAPCTLLFYRDASAARGAFRQRASYVFDEEPDAYSAYDSGDKTLECTKRPMIMPLWTLWSVYGPALFARKIDHLCALTSQAHRMLADEPGFTVLHEPEANILCFRYDPDGLDPAALHGLQLAIRSRVRADGRFFISKVDIDGVAALRVVLMNHRIDAGHLALLLAEIRATGNQVLRERAARDDKDGDRP